MKPDPGHAETAALRDYVEGVAELLRVEPAASWSEFGSPSTAYIALDGRSPRHAGRFLMLQWADGAGWSLARWWQDELALGARSVVPAVHVAQR